MDCKHINLFSNNLITKVEYVKQQVIQNRVKRQYSSPRDPGWYKQWSLVSTFTTHAHSK